MDSRPERRKFLQQLAAGGALAALGFGKSLFGENVNEVEPSQPWKIGDSWDTIRADFNLGKQVYMNTGTLGLMSKPTLEAVSKRMEILSTGNYAVDEEIRSVVGKLLNAKPSEISLTHNTTEGINIIAAGLRLRKGDEVIMTDQEHVGNALPWLNRARLDGFRIKVFKPARTANETLELIESLISRKTKVIALPHITCTSGHVLPAREIAALAKSKGILSFFDGAHGPGMVFPDMEDIGCDFYAACGHKWLCGPAGTGMLFVKEALLDRVQAQMVGAYSDTGWVLSTSEQSISKLVSTAHRFDYATQNPALLIGLKTAIQYQSQIGIEKIRARIAELGDHLQQKIMEHGFAEMLTPTEASSRAGMIGFKLKGKSLKEIEQSEMYKRFRIRLVPESGLDSVRISTHIYTSMEEIDELVDAIRHFMTI